MERANQILSEKDLEDYLWDNPKAIGVKKWIARQFPVPSGIIDLLGIVKHPWNEMDCLIVVELKKNIIDGNAIAQVCRYAYNVDLAIMEALGDYQPHNIVKMVIGGGASDSAVHEARAMDVHIRFYDTKIEYKITGDIDFIQNYKDEIKAHLKELAKNEELVGIYRGGENG